MLAALQAPFTEEFGEMEKPVMEHKDRSAGRTQKAMQRVGRARRGAARQPGMKGLSSPSTPCRRLTTLGWGGINTPAGMSSSVIISVPSFSLNSFCFLFPLRGKHECSPHDHKLCSHVSHIWGNRRGQHIQSAMKSLTLGKSPS